MTENDLRVLDTLETSDYITGELMQVCEFVWRWSASPTSAEEPRT